MEGITETGIALLSSGWHSQRFCKPIYSETGLELSGELPSIIILILVFIHAMTIIITINTIFLTTFILVIFDVTVNHVVNLQVSTTIIIIVSTIMMMNIDEDHHYYCHHQRSFNIFQYCCYHSIMIPSLWYLLLLFSKLHPMVVRIPMTVRILIIHQNDSPNFSNFSAGCPRPSLVFPGHEHGAGRMHWKLPGNLETWDPMRNSTRKNLDNTMISILFIVKDATFDG